MSLDTPDQGAKLGVTLPLSSLLGGLAYATPALGAHVVLPVQVGVSLCFCVWVRVCSE